MKALCKCQHLNHTQRDLVQNTTTVTKPDNHFLSTQVYLPDADRKFFAKTRLVQAIDCAFEKGPEQGKSIFFDNMFITQAATKIMIRILELEMCPLIVPLS